MITEFYMNFTFPQVGHVTYVQFFMRYYEIGRTVRRQKEHKGPAMLLCYRHTEQCKTASEWPQSASCEILCLRSLYISTNAMLLLARPVAPSVHVLDKASRV